MAKKFYELTDGGSSPRERGKQFQSAYPESFERLIPA